MSPPNFGQVRKLLRRTVGLEAGGVQRLGAATDGAARVRGIDRVFHLIRVCPGVHIEIGPAYICRLWPENTLLRTNRAVSLAASSDKHNNSRQSYFRNRRHVSEEIHLPRIGPRELQCIFSTDS